MEQVPGGHPIVVGDGAAAGPRAGATRALFYGHYDVQPVDPLELWRHPPFEPSLGPGATGVTEIRGRGASDDKGQLMTFLEAVRAWTEVAGRPPIDVAFLLEGEEEAGGESMAPFLERHGAALKADYALDLRHDDVGNGSRPAITLSLRGLVGGALTIRAASGDLHSGHYGSAARNPLAVLARILADLRAEDGSRDVTGLL